MFAHSISQLPLAAQVRRFTACMLGAGLPSNVRSRSGQRCSPSRNGRLARPCDRSTYTYMSSGRSPARLVSFSRAPPRCGPDRDRAWHLWSSSSRSAAPRPRAPLATAFGGSLRSGDTPLPAPPLPASSRRYAPPCFVGGIPPPCLARVRWRITRTVVAPFPCAPL
jgi:hypothetical protein